MVSLKTRRLAVPVVVACAGVLAGASPRAFADGGLSVTPAVLEHTAQARQRRLVHARTTRPRRRCGDRHGAAVAPAAQRQRDRRPARERCRATSRATTRPFTIGAGAKRPVSFRMVRARRRRLALRRVEVVRQADQHQGPQGHHPAVPDDLLDAPQRAAPRRSTSCKTGAAPRCAPASLVLPVRNLGNTIDPVAGTYTLSGAGARNGHDRRREGHPGQARRPQRSAPRGA